MTAFRIHGRARGGLVIRLTVMAIIATGPTAWAQSAVASEWRQGTTLSAFAGAGTTFSDTSPATGVSLGWEVTPRFGLEGRGIWLHAGPGESAFAALLAPRVSLLPGRAFNPFVSAGVGMYRASFAGTSTPLPGFYERRLAVGQPRAQSQTFEDLLLAVGGGGELFVSSHFAIRPEATVLFVTTRSETQVVPVYGVHLAFHFEAHTPSPAVRGR